jgi:hypothetical protein
MAALFEKRHTNFIAQHLRENAASPKVIREWAQKLRSTDRDFDYQRFVVAASPPADLDELERDEAEAIERRAKAIAEATS